MFRSQSSKICNFKKHYTNQVIFISNISTVHLHKVNFLDEIKRTVNLVGGGLAVTGHLLGGHLDGLGVSLSDDFSFLFQDHFNVSRRAHVSVDTTVGTVSATATGLGTVDLVVLDDLKFYFESLF